MDRGSSRRIRSLGVAVIAACGGELFHIDVEEESVTEVEGATLLEELVGDFGFGDFIEMDLTESEELKNQGVAPGDIRDVYLVEFELTATAPEGADLSFISAMDVYVEAPDLARVLIATLDEFPEGQPNVSFDVLDVDLTDYVVSQSMTFTTDVTGNRPDDDTTVEAYVLVDVGVTAQGACSGAGR